MSQEILLDSNLHEIKTYKNRSGVLTEVNACVNLVVVSAGTIYRDWLIHGAQVL